MQKLLTCLIALPLLGVGISSAHAAYMGWAFGTMWTPSSALIEDFNSYTPGTTVGSMAILGGTLESDVNIGEESTPGTNFLGVGGTGAYVYVTGGSSVTLTLPTGMSYLGMLWGTVDDFNSIAFYDGGTLIGSFDNPGAPITGADLLPPAEGDTAVYANFYAHGGTFDRVVFSSGSNSFEFDNLAVAETPLPAAVALFGTAVAALGFLGRRRRLV